VRLGDDVEERHLADDRGDPLVGGSGGERVSAAHRRPESRHPVGIDAGQGPPEGERRPPILELPARPEEVRLAAAVAEAAMVEDQGLDAGGREALGEGPQAVAPGSRKAVCHHHQRRRTGSARDRIEPGGTRVGARCEDVVLPLHIYKNGRGLKT
jgi:hypothetical protein